MVGQPINDVPRILLYIASCSDPAKLRRISTNAADQGLFDVRRTAQLRLYEVLPSAKPDTLEFDVWRSIHALEGELKEERKKTVLLSRTRQKIARDGEQKTGADLILGKESEGFRMLLDRNMPRLTFEAVALRHAERFDAHVLEAAKARLVAAGLDPRDMV